jgi:tetratricopeptide (TPR) repeat protein
VKDSRLFRRRCQTLCMAVTCLFSMALVVGCAGAEQRGDHAMEMGRYDIALEYYDEEIGRGSRDPDLYYRAAVAAQRQGAFARAERYYSQSLRYGGGNEVARALAEFYIQTSNFTQAVRVLQFLVSSEEDDESIQPLYSNIGTALMYAGNYLDAEFYLLLAQQMDPSDSIPYINLGVLYDRHLRNRPKSVMFYHCYVEMAPDGSRARQVRTRLREIENQGPVDTSRVNLECGEEYRMAPVEHVDLTQVFDLGLAEEAAEEQRALQQEEGKEESDDDEEPSELRIVHASPDGEDSTAPAGGEERSLEDAQEAYQSGRYDEAVQFLEAVDSDDRSTEERQLLGQAYRQVGRFEESAEVLESVLRERPTPELARLLIANYDELDDQESKERVCQRFSGWPDYASALDACQ